MYIILESGTKLPFEEDRNLEPVTIPVSFAENIKANWLPEVVCELDEGAPMLIIPLPILKSIGIVPKPEGQVTLQMADGQESQAIEIKLSLRIKATNNEVICLHEVVCQCPQDGETILIGRSIQQVFRKIVVQNKLMELVLLPKAQTWMRLED